MAILLSIKTISGKEKNTLFTSVFFMGLLYVTVSLYNGNSRIFSFLTMLFLFGCCIISASVSFKTLLQKKIDNAFAGRVFAVAGSVGNAAIPGAMIIYGILLERYSFKNLLMISGWILILLSMLSFMLYKEKET
jgi:predicted MFS family arabinose efflux permease